MSEHRDGLLIILDDINGLASKQEFADWIKSWIDAAAITQESFPVCFLLIGLEERRQAMIKCNSSLARAFELVNLAPWSKDEAAEFFTRAFRGANMICDADALDMMVRYTGGLPVVAHEIGDAVFHAASDDVVDSSAAISGTLNAAQIVGRKYLEPRVFAAIQSGRYKSILRRICADSVASGQRFTRQETLAGLSVSERSVFDNFVRKMKDLGVLLSEEPGVYRFVNDLHALYFWTSAQALEQR